MPHLWYVVVLLPQKRFFERFCRILSSPFTVPNNRRTRKESLFWRGSSPGAIFPHKIASLRFQTSQQKGRKIHASPRTFRSKIHPKGPELALQENYNPTVFERSKCVAWFIHASQKMSRWLPLFDWMWLTMNAYQVFLKSVII